MKASKSAYRSSSEAIQRPGHFRPAPCLTVPRSARLRVAFAFTAPFGVGVYLASTPLNLAVARAAPYNAAPRAVVAQLVEQLIRNQ